MFYQIYVYLFPSIASDINNQRHCKRIDRNSKSSANEIDRLAPLLDFGVLEF